MKNAYRWLVTASLLILATGAFAQGPFGNMTPQQMQVMQAKRRKWEAWRQNHKQISALQSTLFGFNELEKDPKTQLTKGQAKQVLAVIKKWRNKTVMTDDQARLVNKQITASLTPLQLQKMATARPMRGGPGFGGGARAGGPRNGGGQGGGANGRRSFDPTRFPDPAEYNPLNPDSSPMAKMSPDRGQRMKSRFNGFVASLQARAK